jgi:hypothetical protein
MSRDAALLAVNTRFQAELGARNATKAHVALRLQQKQSLPGTWTNDTTPPDTTEPTKENTLNSPLDEVGEVEVDRRVGGEVDDDGDKRLSQAESSMDTDGLDMANSERTGRTHGT